MKGDSIRGKLLLVLAAIAVSLLALEIGLRVYLTRFGDERQKALYLYTREELQRQPTLYRSLSFLNYGLSPSHSEHNSRGYRGDEVVVPKPEGVYRIVALGGSTTYGIPLGYWKNAYPWALQETLRDIYGLRQIEAVNAGAPQYTSWESAVSLLLRVPDLEPDLVIIYHGINDLLARLVDPAWYDGVYTGRGYWRDYNEPLPPSALLRFALSKLGQDIDVPHELRSTFVVPDDFRSCKPSDLVAEGSCSELDITVREVLAANPPVYFERNLRSMITLARDMGSRVLLLTWAYSPLEYDVPRNSSMARDYMQEGIAEQNAIVRALAAELGTLFYDLAAKMPIDRELWADDLHMNEAGARVMAELLAEYLAGAGEVDGE